MTARWRRLRRLSRSLVVAGLLTLQASDGAPRPLRAAAGMLLARLWPDVARPSVKPGRLVIYS